MDGYGLAYTSRRHESADRDPGVRCPVHVKTEPCSSLWLGLEMRRSDHAGFSVGEDQHGQTCASERQLSVCGALPMKCRRTSVELQLFCFVFRSPKRPLRTAFAHLPLAASSARRKPSAFGTLTVPQGNCGPGEIITYGLNCKGTFVLLGCQATPFP